MTNDLKPPPESATQLPADQTTTTTVGKLSRNYDVMHVVLRIVSLSASLISIAVLTSAKEKSTVLIYGFQLSLYSKWSFSGSFEYLVCVSAVVAFHSLLQLVMTSSRMLRKSSIFSSRNHAWIIFASDQVGYRKHTNEVLVFG
ncbi:putative casparian strip membrane protein [Helianthus annuus]|nr:putative casparian strip membrane protein [Helianthus annuus]